MSSTSLSSMPRSARAARVTAMSSTTRWRPLTEPGTISVYRAHPCAEDNGAARPRRGELYHPHRFRDLGVVQIPEASLLVERPRPVNIRHRKRDKLQAHVRYSRSTCHRSSLLAIRCVIRRPKPGAVIAQSVPGATARVRRCEPSTHTAQAPSCKQWQNAAGD